MNTIPARMENYFNQPIILTGETVDLIPLEEKYFAELIEAASDKRVWEFYSFDGSEQGKMLSVLQKALIEKQAGTQYPFVIYHKAENKLIGSTRLMDIQIAHRKLEIGGTWLHPDYWASAINPECKLLLLTFCFEKLNAVRVQLKTDVKNIRSQKAIEKIGGKYEGVFRNDMIRDNGTKRNSVYFSIIDDEWNETKKKLSALVQQKKSLNK